MRAIRFCKFRLCPVNYINILNNHENKMAGAGFKNVLRYPLYIFQADYNIKSTANSSCKIIH